MLTTCVQTNKYLGWNKPFKHSKANLWWIH